MCIQAKIFSGVGSQYRAFWEVTGLAALLLKADARPRGQSICSAFLFLSHHPTLEDNLSNLFKEFYNLFLHLLLLLVGV